MLGSTVHILQSLLKFLSIQSMMLSNHFILCHPLLLLPSIFLSIRVFCNELALLITWPKYWSFNSASVLPTNRIDFFQDLLVWSSCSPWDSQESSSAPQFETSILCRSDFMIQLSHPYMTTGKNIPLSILTFVSKVRSLFFNRLSRFIIAFLPRSNSLLISELQSLSTVILEPKKIK